MELISLVTHPSPDDSANAVALVTLNDPGRRNVLSTTLVAELVEVLDAVEADTSVGALVVTGAPPAFCAGADLGSLAAQGDRVAASTSASASTSEPTAADGQAGLRGIYEGFLRFAESPLPTIAAVNGPAVGAGMNLALACDLRVCGRAARFDTRFLDLGLHPGGGHTFMLQRIVGPQVAAAMVLFCERYDGEAAVEHGLAYKCVADDELLDAALALARRAASVPRDLSLRAKQTLGEVSKLDEHAKAVDVELAAQVWSLGQPFFAERVAKLRERVSGRPES